MTIVMPDTFEDLDDNVIEFDDGAGTGSSIAQIVAGIFGAIIGVIAIGLAIKGAAVGAMVTLGVGMLVETAGGATSACLGIKEGNALKHESAMEKVPTPGF